MKLKPEDLDNAIKDDWSTRTCLIAQCFIRHGTTLYPIEAEQKMGYIDPTQPLSPEALDLMKDFDDCWSTFNRQWDKDALRKIRQAIESKEIEVIVTLQNEKARN